jgi:hypothetical protein
MLGLVNNLGGDSLSPMNIEIYVRGGGVISGFGLEHKIC